METSCNTKCIMTMVHTCIPHVNPVFAKNEFHPLINIPVWGIAGKNQSLAIFFQVHKEALQMRRRIKISAGIIRNYPVKVSRDVGVTNRSQDIFDSIIRAIVNVPFFEEMDCICNQAALCHTKQIIEWFKPRLALIGVQRSLSSIFFIDS